MNVTVELAGRSAGSNVPDTAQFRSWVSSALNCALAGETQVRNAVVSIRLVDESESAALNRQYRNRSGATNVLSFPGTVPADIQALLKQTPLGDLAICTPVVEREASEQGKPLVAHWAHMTVHGTLHLLGHDHQADDQAERMETLETGILESLGFSNPYHC